VLSFRKFLINEGNEGAKRNAAGVLHELLAAKNLNNGKFPEQHRSQDGLTPEEAHNKYKQHFSESEYSGIAKRAEAAANDIRKQVTSHGSIHKVHWTSKPGDIEKVTGIKSTQKEDPSDIVITTKHPVTGVIKHHTVSLKVTKDTPSTTIISANRGAEASVGAHRHYTEYKKQIKSTYKGLASATNKPQRKEWMENNPEHAKQIGSFRKQMITNTAKTMSQNLKSMSKEELSHHIRHNVLSAVKTPSQHAGHSHIRHITYRDGQTRSFDPGTHYDHILNDHENLSVEHRGGAVVFMHKGKAFASQAIKLNSSSDPMSSLNLVGKPMGGNH
jgi:hypothetical protein